jgi:hypothetical protein
VEASFQRISRLKQQRLNGFTGVGANELVERLTGLDHRRVVEEIQGSL